MSNNIMKQSFIKYVNNGIIPFSVQIEKKLNKKGEYKKEVIMPKWKESTLSKTIYISNYNCVGLKTGQESGIFVLDIDDVNEWNQILKDEEREEPETATVITGSGGLHYYFKYTDDLNIIPSRAKIIGDKIDSRGNGGCIYAPPSKYYSEESKCEVSYNWKEGKSIFDYKELPKVPKWIMNLMLKTIEKDNKPKETKETKETKTKDVKIIDLVNVELEQTKIKLTNEQITELINMINGQRADDYSSWISVMFILKCENNNDNLKHFIEFSKKSKSYDEEGVISKWNKYNANKKQNKLTYNTLLFYAKNDNPTKYKEFTKKYLIKDIEDESDIIINDNIIINQPYLLKNKTLENDIVSNYINEYLKNDNDKILFIKSAYDTGKTTLLKTITPKYQKILFISYRITLSENLLGGFPDFEIYYNSFMEDKIICQVDSLDKLSINNYDLVIIDESESVLNHFSASSLKNPKDTFELFCSYLYNAKKIICLDGDLGNRTKKIISAFGNVKIITNNIKKDTNHFIFTPNEKYFNEDIDKALEAKKNIVVVCMSDTKAKQLYAEYKNNYKCILYTSSTSDKEKQNLGNVEEEWKKYQLIIYTPSIESGVDFNVDKYIDNIYVVLCSNSTSQRGLNQMIKRCRKLNNKNILIYTNNLSLQDKMTLNYFYYSINEIKTFYSTLMNEKITFDLVDGVLVRNNKYNYDLYDILTLYNKQEQLNKNNNCFIPLFIKMISDKGHTYEIVEGKGKKDEKKENIIHTIIKEAEEINDEQYEELIKKQTKRLLEENEKIQIKKYIYEKTFNIKFDNDETIKQYYGRLNIIKNCYQLFNDNNKFKNSKIINKEKEQKINVINEIILLFKLTNIKDETCILKNEDLKDNIENLNTILKTNKILLGLDKNIKIESTQGVLGSLRSILSNYGIDIEQKQKQEKKGENKVNYYYFSLDENVKNKINNCYIVNFMKDFNF